MTEFTFQSATTTIKHNELGKSFNFDLSATPETVHFSKKIEVIAWQPERLD